MSTNNKHSIVRTKDLVIGYTSKKKQQVIANAINIDAQEGKLVALLGKNGIGKSTLLRTLAKVQPKLGGQIMLDGNTLENISAKTLAQKISLVLTERVPHSNLTVYELIALGRQPYTNWIGTLTKNDKEFIQQAIANTNIEELTEKRCDQLSDGQLQKVMIARALAQNTELIILDEPTAHLDIHHKVAIFNLLKTLVEKFKKTIIISTHEVQLAIQLADDLWLLNEEGFVSGNTQHLINSNKLSTLFNSQFVKFDQKSKQFIFST